MSEQYVNEPMLEMYIFETEQLIEQLEQNIISCEKASSFSENTINEIFRIMHTIKGSSTMMLFDNLALLAHSIEDLFYFIRERKPQKVDYSMLSDLILEAVDFIKGELENIKTGLNPDSECSGLIKGLNNFLLQCKEINMVTEEKKKDHSDKKQQYYISQDKTQVRGTNYKYYEAVIFFEDGCEMENIRAYSVVNDLQEITNDYCFYPADVIDSDESSKVIRKQGFKIFAKADKTYEEMQMFYMKTPFIKELLLQEIILLDYEKKKQNNGLELTERYLTPPFDKGNNKVCGGERISTAIQQTMISVNVNKLDKLMDLVGEMVIAEAMVTQNPDLRGLELENFSKAARQLHKITSEIQDMVMSIRMVPLTTTFHKMQRIVRDMSKKLGKEVELRISGEETEVDKNIIEHISDPLMHIVRNSIDHGIEGGTERKEKGKQSSGIIQLEAKNAGSDVLIVIKDDGRGLDKAKILERAIANGLIDISDRELSDKEIFQLIFLPGFSTKEEVTEFSGRGVGMDVVTKSLETVGGSVLVDSVPGAGATITLKLPLTLAIIDGMNIRVGNCRYTIPTVSIKESFRPKEGDLVKDPDGNEMIMVRGQCYPIVRLHEIFKVSTGIKDFIAGILIMVEQDEKGYCIFADELLGQQQVVVKSLPNYIKGIKNIAGLAGCTLLGDGSISLILDIAGLSNWSDI